MTLYTYRALGKDGAILKGQLDTPSRRDLRFFLEEKGVSLISVSRSYEKTRELFFHFFYRLPTPTLKEFYQHLIHFEKARIPLRESLNTLMQTEKNRVFKRALTRICEDIDKGMLFSAALGKHPLIFEAFCVSMIESAEKTGRLLETFVHLVSYFTWKEDVRNQISKAVRYPLLMSVLLIVILGFFLSTLVPELVSLIREAKGNLPFSTRLLIGLSSALHNYGYSIVGIPFVGSLGGLLFLKIHPRGPSFKSFVLDKIPVLGQIQRHLFLSHFFCLFSALIQGGIDTLKALEIACKTIYPSSLKHALERAQTYIYQGHTLSSAFEKVGLFSPLILRMIHVGEETNTLPQNVETIRVHVDDITKRRIETFVSLLEPALLLIVGVLMAWIVSAVFFPLYDTFTLFEV